MKRMKTETQPKRPLFVFDGDCGFCTMSVDWVGRRLREPAEIVPWQRLDLEELGLSQHDVDRYAWWIEPAEPTEGAEAQGKKSKWRGHRAAGRALRRCRGLWPWLGAVLLAPPPISWIWAAGYRLIANMRGILPGATPACKLPPAERPADKRS